MARKEAVREGLVNDDDRLTAGNSLSDQQIEQAGFAVLKAPDIPSALIETAFISNPDEERRLNDDAYQDKLADAIVRGVRQFFIKHPPGPKARLASIA